MWIKMPQNPSTVTMQFGRFSAMLTDRGTCPHGECHKWIFAALPFVSIREIEVESQEDAQGAAIAILRTEISNLLKQLPE